MEHQVGRPDATVPVARRFQLPAQHPADAIQRAQPASDALAAAPPDAAADAEMIPALAAERYVEKLAVPAPVVPEPDAMLHSTQKLPPQAKAPYIPDAGRSAA
jgi:hypothetical protein